MPKAKRLLKVFISYASQDKPIVQEFSRRLVGEGWVDPWVDEKKLLPGQDWRTKIEEAVETSDIVIICLSNNSVSKEGFVQKELRYAREIAFEKPEEIIFLVPLRLDDCVVPRGLRFFQWGDYFGEKREDTYTALLEALKIRHEQKLKHEDEERACQEKERLEREANEGIAREKAEQATAERIAREKADKEAAEKAKREKAEHEVAERNVREMAKREAAEKAKRDAAEKSRRKTTERQLIKDALTEAYSKTKPFLLVVSIVGIVGLLLWIGSRVISNASPFAASAKAPTAMLALTSSPIVTASPVPSPSPTSTFTFTPTPVPLQTEIIDVKGIEMVLVSEGYFTMGDEKHDNEKPTHEVYLESYYIDVYEVTNASYKACEDEGVCASPQKKSSANQDDYYGNPKFDNYPVVYVDWNMARAYCEWRKALLPTEAVWEKAARGAETTSNVFPWGDEIDETFANYNQNIGDTTAVGTYKKGESIYGAYDMGGNVWEWVSSLYMPYPYNATDGREDFNATGPRILRGGSWLNIADNLRVTGRLRAGATNTSSYVGFRCYRLP